MTESWRPVKGFDGAYEISSYGRVRSLSRTIVLIDGRRRTFPGRAIDGKRNVRSGYLQVGLYRGNKCQMAYVHRLVAQAFLPNPHRKRCVNHLDGDRIHNHVNNLEWATHSENTRHAHATGLAKALSGERANTAKITRADALQLRSAVWSVVKEWAERNGVHTQTAWDVIAGKNWVMDAA